VPVLDIGQVSISLPIACPTSAFSTLNLPFSTALSILWTRWFPSAAFSVVYHLLSRHVFCMSNPHHYCCIFVYIFLSENRHTLYASWIRARRVARWTTSCVCVLASVCEGLGNVGGLQLQSDACDFLTNFSLSAKSAVAPTLT
jgi:hypothetical protein